MKKILLSVLAVITMVCIFAFGASAYENEYFSLDVPSDYEVTEDGNIVQFNKEEKVLITINTNENDYTDFYNMPSSECAKWDEKIKDAYSSIGTISNYESEFDGDGVSKSAMFYSFDFSNPDDASEVYTAEGMVWSENGIVYNIFVLMADDEAYSEAQQIMETIEFTPSGSSSGAVASQKIYYEGDNGNFTLTVPAGLDVVDAPAPIDKMWCTESGTYAISTFITDNLLHEALANLDSAAMEKMKNDVVAGANYNLKNAKAEDAVFRGIEGLHIYGDYDNGSNTATMDVYMFSTYEKLYAVYFYDFGDYNADTYKREVLNTLNIEGEILGASGSAVPSTQPSTQPVLPSTQPSTQPLVPTVPGDVTEQTTTAAAEEEDEDKKDEEKDNTTLYIIIGAVVLIVLIAVIAIVVISNNKKKAAQNTAMQYAQPFNPQQYQNNYPQNPPMNNYNNEGYNQNNNNNF